MPRKTGTSRSVRKTQAKALASVRRKSLLAMLRKAEKRRLPDPPAEPDPNP